MKKHYILGGGGVRRDRPITSPVGVSDLSFDELYEDISDHWEDKARRLQARRWRKLKNQLI